MKVSKDYLNFQPCTLEGAEANKWRCFEVSLSIVRRDQLIIKFSQNIKKLSCLQRCIRALDEIHIPITDPPYERPRYGLEGSVGDSRVLGDALCRQNKLEIPTSINSWR